MPLSSLKEYLRNTHEIIQLLHHAFTYDFEKILLLIGDRNANIIRGIWISFPEELKQSYGLLLQVVYDRSLAWAYHSAETLPEEVIKEELESIKGIDYDSFMDHLKLWRCVNTNIPKPLPTLQRIIPRIYATWNCMKGGSDTTTKLLWQVKQGHLVPIASSQVCYLIVFLLLHLFMDLLLNLLLS